MSDLHPLVNKQLELLNLLDEARDSIDDNTDPLGMFHQIVRIMKTFFDAEACAILLVNVQVKEVDIISTLGMPRPIAETMCRHALDYETPLAVKSDNFAYTLGLQIKLDREDHTVGSVVLACNNREFTDDDVELLTVAESQIDSAVMQARTLWRLAERNRELEAIYQIDRLRDDSPDEDTLFQSFARLMIKHFQAQLCQFIMRDEDTKQLHTQAIIAKPRLSEKAQQALIESVRDIQTTTIMDAPVHVRDMFLMATPFIVSGERLGAVVVGRKKDFNVNDTRLMIAMTSQMDSALAKVRTARELAQRKRELEAIYRIDRIRDRETDFDSLLQQVLVELCDAVSSETGYIMLYNADEENPLELRATNDDIRAEADTVETIERISREALNTESVVMQRNLNDNVDSIVATPLILNERVIGVFGAINSYRERGFTNDDGRMLHAITSQVDTAVFERLERRRMRQVMSRSVDPKVLEILLAKADTHLLQGERVVLTVLFADLRNSTVWVEETPAEEIVSMLNTFLGKMTDVIFQHGGTLDKFVGDEVIALFGSLIPMDDHAHSAVKAALDMQQVHQELQAEFEENGKFIPPMGIGLSSGSVITGEIGPPIQTDFTAIGRVMNLGARLCSAADGNQIIISENTYDDTQPIIEARELDQVPLKGISRTVQTYELIRLLDDAQ